MYWIKELIQLSKHSFRRNNVFFIPVVEHWSSFIPSAEVLEGSWEFAQPVNICFVELEMGFNPVPHAILLGVLCKYVLLKQKLGSHCQK